MKQLSSYMVLSVSGGDRISLTYDEINDETGDVESTNNKATFFVTDAGLRGHVEAIRDWIRQHKLAD